MKYKYVFWFVLVLAFVLAPLAFVENYLHAIGPMIVLATVTYGGFFLVRWVLFRVGGVGGKIGSVDDDYLKWVEENRPKPPKIDHGKEQSH